MKHQFLFLAALSLLCSSCLTRIVTVSPTAYKPAVVHTAPAATPVYYTTTVTTPKVRTVSTAQVTPVSSDISLYLDLQAVGAAFAQAATVQEFEALLNNSNYMLSNLDLNGDGYVDYLRVLETVNGYTHVFLIQAVLAANIYQDVATVVAEVPTIAKTYVQVIGTPYIYGPNYIVEPTYIVTPKIFSHFIVKEYRPWSSPWYWNHYPTYYRHPAPIIITHYQAYVKTYMSSHHYCHTVTYPTVCHYPQYAQVAKPYQRNDYEQQHPERSFVTRTASTATSTRTASSSTTSTPARTANASDVRSQQAATVTTTTTPRTATAASSTSRTATAASTTRTSTSATTTTPARTTTTTAAAKPATTTTSSRTASASAGSAASTTVRSNVRASGSSTTRTTVTAPATTSTRSASTTTSTRSASASTSTRSASATTGSAASTRTAPASGGSPSRTTTTTTRR